VTILRDGHGAYNVRGLKFVFILRESQDAMIVKKLVYIHLKKDFLKNAKQKVAT
jgi:hypothetical protein